MASKHLFVYFLYNLVLLVISFFLGIIARFNSKMGLFVQGRKATFPLINKNIASDDKVIWVHAASLGEFEQGLPVIQQIRTEFPEYKILLTFFSPSGYEVKKNTPAADLVCYLPLDTATNVDEFLKCANPKIAIFVKYEIWPNYFKGLRKRGVPLLLISAIFKKEQIYFKWYGGFMRNSLKQVDHFFLQNETSESLLSGLGYSNITIAGDTRFDRVNQIKKQDNALDFMAEFKGNKPCMVIGSSWPEDEKILVPFINRFNKSIRFVIAPHNIKKDHIEKLRGTLNNKTVLFSEYPNIDVEDPEILVLDTIGLLTQVYSYGDLAYVGGGFATGLHNTLEPAAFGIPIIIGPQYAGFIEAETMVKLRGCFSIQNAEEFGQIAEKLINNPEFRKETGQINAAYVEKNKGASIQIIAYMRTLL